MINTITQKIQKTFHKMQNDLSRGRLMFNGMSFGLQDLHDGRVASIATHTNNLLQ